MLNKQPIQHLAIFVPPFLDLILDGKKTIEGRFSRVRCAPFEAVEEGDVVLMKKSGGFVCGAFVVAKVETFRNLNSEALKNLEVDYSKGLCADADPLYWKRRADCKYATLLHVGSYKRFDKPFPFPKKDRRGWVVLEKQDKEIDAQLRLFEDNTSKKKYNPLESRCANGLHTFFRSPLVNSDGHPRCRWCGADCVNWPFLHQRDIKVLDLAINELRKEYWRNSWFRRDIDLRAKNHALRKGRKLLREHAKNRIRKSVGPSSPYRDSFQTPYANNVIYYAQHAVAACCRNCIEVWHGIPKGKELADMQVTYLTELVMKYVDVVMPELKDEGIHVPPIKKPCSRKE